MLGVRTNRPSVAIVKLLIVRLADGEVFFTRSVVMLCKFPSTLLSVRCSVIQSLEKPGNCWPAELITMSMFCSSMLGVGEGAGTSGMHCAPANTEGGAAAAAFGVAWPFASFMIADTWLLVRAKL